ncbi:MAG: hypothetical protein ACTS6A_02460 [Candidatus Hodgkinia cicadicola]
MRLVRVSKRIWLRWTQYSFLITNVRKVNNGDGREWPWNVEMRVEVVETTWRR